MDSRLINRRDLDFLLFELLDLDGLFERSRFVDHSRETVAAAIDTAHAIAQDHFAPHNHKSDENEPQVIDGKVVIIPEVKEALRRFIDAGFLAATADYELGGMQLPFTAHMAVSTLFAAASLGTKSYPSLTMAAANVLRAFGTPDQKERFMRPMLEGRFFGTMALTEPQAGSSLSDLRTAAVPADDGSYRLTGNKIFISGGDHELAENIVHLVLARLPDAPAGVKGISLFIVPKFLVNEDGSLGARNDVALAGLIHKMGWRGTTSTMLNFGEGGGAVGWMVGEPHKGLVCMFHMMNEARIGVGNGAAALAGTAYRHALAYAKERPQGRVLDSKDPATPQVPIIEHPDVRRMLLAQKSYAEGALALCMTTARLVDEKDTATDSQARADALLLLEILTPMVKSWPAQWCQESISLAMQIHGGYGFTREYPIEQFYRDNRLNPIHEGSHGIQGLDLLGRKVTMNGGRAFALLCARIEETAAEAARTPALTGDGAALGDAIGRVKDVTAILTGAVATHGPTRALANASVYLEVLGHVVVAWLWLRQGLLAEGGLAATADTDERAFYEGKRHACRYFLRWELPKVGPQLDRLAALDDAALAVPASAL
ncbi:acyl-CoA dehydrogenase [Azospirillum agricola]|uniref:acyl-CoA dehydrogenase n=1 Tax=Azospirillum agricola TaxID=1720247 RepID=UPI000A0F2993|nr:acyl-CoA dehydrogenase [Azospirillum agricola]SMH62795.1 butyryl-CoA dehydrogenase [Azospirillum lipoferum]